MPIDEEPSKRVDNSLTYAAPGVAAAVTVADTYANGSSQARKGARRLAWFMIMVFAVVPMVLILISSLTQ